MQCNGSNVWRVRMADIETTVEGATYEHAVAEFEYWLIQHGIERRPAEFTRADASPGAQDA